MDKERVKEAAIDYLDEKYPDFGRKRLYRVLNEGPAFDDIKLKLKLRYDYDCWKGNYDDDARLAMICISPYSRCGDLNKASWYPKQKPQAKLILDECGVKSYEVDRVTEDLQNQFAGDFSEDSSTILHVSQSPVSGGKRTFISSKDYSGKPGYYEFDTAKQALESLGYEVVE